VRDITSEPMVHVVAMTIPTIMFFPDEMQLMEYGPTSLSIIMAD